MSPVVVSPLCVCGLVCVFVGVVGGVVGVWLVFDTPVVVLCLLGFGGVWWWFENSIACTVLLDQG